MASPRSAVLGQWRSDAAADHPLLRIPVGMTAIVKTAVVNNRSGQNRSVSVDIVAASGAMLTTLVRGSLTSTAVDAVFTGWAVAMQNDLLRVSVDGSGLDIWVSGTLLQGVPALPPATQTLPALPTDALLLVR